MGVPAEPPLHLVAAHGPIPRHDVLDVTGEQMPIVREAVGERRPVVEHVLLRVGSVRDAGSERVVAGPIVKDCEFESRKIGCTDGQLGIGGLGHCVRRLHVPRAVSALLSGRGRRRADAQAPRYHPACHAETWPLNEGCDGPTRSVLLSLIGCSSEDSPVMAGSMSVCRFYVAPQLG